MVKTKAIHHRQPGILGLLISGLGLTAVGGYLYSKFGGTFTSTPPDTNPPLNIPPSGVDDGPPQNPPPEQPINPIPGPPEGPHEPGVPPGAYNPYFAVGTKIGIGPPANQYSSYSQVLTIMWIDYTDEQNPVYGIIAQDPNGRSEPFPYDCREFDARYSTFPSWA